MHPKRYISLLIILIVIASINDVTGQSNVSLKLHGIGFLAKKSEYGPIFENNIDPAGRWIFQPGLVLSYEVYLLEYDHAVQFQQGITLDIAAQACGFTWIEYRLRVWKFWRHTVTFGTGPVLYYRSSWDRFPEYRDHGDLDITGNLEYRFMPIGAELEYSYYISNKSDISFSIQYSQPKTVSASIGYKYWIQTKIKHKRKCSTCFYNN
ncbi:MAG: hypothetical protein KJ607_04080 [Bacteroidetes bacterium]|nr:hypothetical protein [Bacteroidota bacterium]